MVFNLNTATETNYLVYEIQWGRWLIPLYTISILGLCYVSSVCYLVSWLSAVVVEVAILIIITQGVFATGREVVFPNVVPA